MLWLSAAAMVAACVAAAVVGPATSGTLKPPTRFIDDYREGVTVVRTRAWYRLPLPPSSPSGQRIGPSDHLTGAPLLAGLDLNRRRPITQRDGRFACGARQQRRHVLQAHQSAVDGVPVKRVRVE